jgi:hypothetical protein
MLPPSPHLPHPPTDARVSRRRCLTLLAGASALGIERLTAAAAAADQTAVSLAPAPGHDLFRVRLLVELGGQVHVPRNVLVSKDRSRQIPIEAESTIDYEERWTRQSDGQITGSQRYYHEAFSTTKVSGGEQRLELRDEARTIVAQTDTGRLTLRGAPVPLRHTEVELLEVPLNSLAIDGLLPLVPVTQGAIWEPTDEAMGRLLNMETVQRSKVKAELVELTDDQAKVQLQGTIDAAVDGVPTAIELAMKVTFDRRQQAITWCAAAVRERRDIGRAEPGFELSARIRMMREPLETASLLPAQLEVGADAAARLVEILSPDGGFQMLTDPQWRVMNDGGGWTMLRCVERDAVLAQCEIRRLHPLPAGRQLTLEGLQSDISRSLGKSFREFIEAEEKLTSNGLRLLRLVAEGRVEEVPVQWIYLHLSDDRGERRSVVFTFEPKQYERALAAEAQIAGSFQLLVDPPAEAGDGEAADGSTDEAATVTDREDAAAAEQAARVGDRPAPR